MARKKKDSFRRPDDPFYDPDDEEQWKRAHGEEDDDEDPIPMINETYLQAFVNAYEPAEHEWEPDVEFFSTCELRNKLHSWVSYSGSGKPFDPLPFYINALSSHGFMWTEGFDGSYGILVRHRNRRHLTTVLNPNETTND